MQMGLREWLIVLLGLLIAFVLFDGWRRMRRRERDRMRFNLDRRFGLSDESQSVKTSNVAVNKSSPIIESAEDDLPLPSLHAEEPAPRRSILRQPEPEPEPIPEPATEPEASPTTPPASGEKSNIADMLVIYVLAKDEKGFFGPTLLQCILESGLRFGEHDIFHRHESKAGSGEILFSMANAVNPSTFDLAEMDHCHIRAVVFYLLLPGPRNPKVAFNEMLAAVRKLESTLGGEVKDDQHSVLTAQTIEHYRRRIAEFERKKLLNR